jgi:hypothetical protein
MAKRKRMSREELDAFLDEVEVRQQELRRLIEEREAARKAREEKKLRRRRLFGLLPG